MDKEDVVCIHTHNGILLSHKKDETCPFAATWIQLEIIILSEINQRKTNICIAYMWNLKYDTKELYLQKRNRLTDIENRFVVAGVGEGYTGSLGLANAN